MSDFFSAKISYDAQFSFENVRKVLLSLAQAVEKNWSMYTDEFTQFDPEDGVKVNDWLADCVPKRMRTSDSTVLYSSPSLFFSFSPVSERFAHLILFEDTGNLLRTAIYVSDRLNLEIQGDREAHRMVSHWKEIRETRGEKPPILFGPYEDDPSYDGWWETYYSLGDTPSVWPQNRACLQHIIGRLRSVLPVRRVEIDKPLEGGEAGYSADNQEAEQKRGT